jgi:hypothetical protein
MGQGLMIEKVFKIISENPGLRSSQIIELLKLPYREVEDAIWDLWDAGHIQCDPDSTLRVARAGENIFRWDS